MQMRSDGAQHPPGSADVQGDLWGARAEVWAEHEEQGVPIFEEVLRRADVGAGARLLDLGCAAGTLCRIAVDQGATVAGLDAADALVEIARRRVPEAEFTRGDVQFLPYEDGAFDVVTAVNSLQFAADPTEAVRQAGRVSRDGGTVAVAVWGAPADVDLFRVVRAVPALVPGPAPARSLLEPGGVEKAMTEAGLEVMESSDHDSAFEFADEETILRQMTSAGGMVRVIREVGEDAVRQALSEVMEGFRTGGGGYRLENPWHLVIARA